MYYAKEIKPRTYYINVFLKDLSFLLAFHNGDADDSSVSAPTCVKRR